MERKINRFLHYLEYKGITENRATVECSLSNGLLGQAKKGKADLGDKAIDKILNTYQDLSKVWLLTGEGEMLKNEGIITEKISGGNQILNQKNSGSTINQNTITIELPERGSKKIINPDGSVKVESESSSDEALTEYLRKEVEELRRKVEELIESNIALNTENAVLKYQITMLEK